MTNYEVEMKIRAAVESALAAMSSPLSTAYENVAFTPVAGTPYQRIEWPGFMTENPTLGDGFYRVRGYFQITLMYPLQEGSKNVLTRAGLLRQLFKRNSSFVKDGVTVIVEFDPIVGSGSLDGDRWSVPFKVRYRADIFP